MVPGRYKDCRNEEHEECPKAAMDWDEVHLDSFSTERCNRRSVSDICRRETYLIDRKMFQLISYVVEKTEYNQQPTKDLSVDNC